jgi:SAM-dependent methyltransferase
MPTAASFREYYLGEYRRNFPVTASAARRASDILDVIERYGSGPVLDVGCARGALLEAAAKHGISAEGVEPDPESVAAAEAFGKVYPNLDQVAGRYAWVVFSHTLEHTPDPVSMLSRGRDLLLPGGMVYALVPSPLYRGRWNLILPHPVMMLPDALRLAVERARLDVVELKPGSFSTMLVARPVGERQ